MHGDYQVIRSLNYWIFLKAIAVAICKSTARTRHCLLGIIDALRTTYPRNVNMGPRWMNTPHRRMKERTPVHTMLEDGESGVITVLSELDCAYAWELSGSTTPKC